MFLTKRGFILPVAVTVSILVILLGIKVQNYARPAKEKSAPRTVLELQAKDTKEGLDKSGQPFAIRNASSTFAPTTFPIEVFHHEPRCNGFTAVISAPARASPALFS